MKFPLVIPDQLHKPARWFMIVLLVLISLGGIAQSDECYPPKPNGLVVDAVDILSPADEATLERRLQAFNRETSNQIVVVTLDSLCEGDAAMTAYKIGEMWGVGQKEFDNGIVILIKPTGGPGQRHTFIATGYGLEGAIPDATAKLIVDREMIPAFRNQNYLGGLIAALDVITELAKGEYTYKDYQKKESKGSPLAGIIPFLFILGIWFFLMYRKTSTYARDNDLGFWAALMLMSASSRSHRGRYGSFSGGSGGFGGFGGGGGGFGGFGGGSFGGGGAGGSW
jgi:uncharacterized protein